MTQRVAVFGDVGGWRSRLEEALSALGADCENGLLPESLEVVQVGDLVHKGPDSVGVLALVDRFLYGSPGRWHQLMGNHEAQYFGALEFWVSSPLLPHHQSDLRRWRSEGSLRLAVAIEAIHGAPVLVTHAGLTRPRWEQLGRPASPADAAVAIEEEVATVGFADALRAGMGVANAKPDPRASVVWAMPHELLCSWERTPPPFSMVVGHATPVNWDARDRWRGSDIPYALRPTSRLDQATHHVHVPFGNGTEITFIDPTYERTQAAIPLTPLLIEGRVTA